MDQRTEEKLAQSLTGKSITEIIPFLSYLLQDLWELGAIPGDIVQLIAFHQINTKNLKVLDLGCGKGAVSIELAKAFGFTVKGIDLLPEFIEYARQKAEEMKVSSLCQFVPGDMNLAVETEKDYDMVILGSVGSVLGGPLETLLKLKKVLKPERGYIILDDAYIRDPENDPVLKSGGDYYSYAHWLEAFDQAGLLLIGEKTTNEAELAQVNESNNLAIIKRARELKAKYPDKAQLFDDYIKNQQDECDDLAENILGVTWLLRTGEKMQQSRLKEG
ncbi:MAG TPA: class I SAM-dependent methyltransferase [Syntrophomonadaceae bacterium]|nr:class I SAM-dependent methyltransferase [Syntrophomonadaceae bacterium]HRX20500.1 class I SAM-dependent methyltransferase [Syntrophomonadaceae bacterium]